MKPPSCYLANGGTIEVPVNYLLPFNNQINLQRYHIVYINYSILQYLDTQIPVGCTEIHHEIELGVVIASRITRASPKEAFSAVGGYALVLDMTVRDFQVKT